MSQQQTSTNPNQTNKTQKKSLELYLPPSLTQKKTVVLDLDETLVHSQFGAFNIPSDVVINIEIENELHEIHVLIRPGVKEFLEKMSKLYEIVIFTASISKYAGPLLDILDKEKFCSFRLFREHCTLINSSFVKDLKKLGRDLKNIIIVDNSPLAYLLNSDNGLPILTWFDDKYDQELYKITPVLEFLSEVPDVREYINKMVVNNEISYINARKVINDYHEKNKKKNNEKEKREIKTNNKNKISEDNFEINDGSDNNLAIINKQDKNQQQININIINNNITNYIYENNKQIKDENISDNIIKGEIDNKIPNHNFNPNSIIASVAKSDIIPKFNPLTPFIKENKAKNKNSNSTNKINNNKNIILKNNSQNKINNYVHKKSESTGYGYKLKAKKKNFDEIDNNMNNAKNNMNKNNPVRNNTNYNYNSKSQNKHEQNMKNNANKNNKSAKILSNVKKQFYLNDKNISVNKKNILKENNDKNPIKFLNDGNHTTVHNRQKIQLNINNVEKNNVEKTYRNYNKKNKTTTANNLLHSVDLAKNEIAMYYHNEHFPFTRQETNINSGGFTNKNRNINKFLKNNNLKNKKSTSIDNEINKNIKKENKFEHAQRFNNIKLNNDFKYTNNKKKGKNIIINHTLQEEQKKEKPSNNINNNNLLKEHNKNNSSININANTNINLANSAHINPRSGSVKNIITNDKGETKEKKAKNEANKRPKSSNLFKKNKYANRRKQIRRNASGRYAKQINIMKYDIIEILERRGIAKTNRIKYFKDNIQNNETNNNNNNYEKKKEMNNIVINQK